MVASGRPAGSKDADGDGHSAHPGAQLERHFVRILHVLSRVLLQMMPTQCTAAWYVRTHPTLGCAGHYAPRPVGLCLAFSRLTVPTRHSQESLAHPARLIYALYYAT